jgi:hypothetical protein
VCPCGLTSLATSCCSAVSRFSFAIRLQPMTDAGGSHGVPEISIVPVKPKPKRPVRCATSLCTRPDGFGLQAVRCPTCTAARKAHTVKQEGSAFSETKIAALYDAKGPNVFLGAAQTVRSRLRSFCKATRTTTTATSISPTSNARSGTASLRPSVGDKVKWRELPFNTLTYSVRLLS